MPDFEQARHSMVETQIRARGVRDPLVLVAMRTVPREKFVDEGYEDFAYDDTPLPIGHGQTISQPFIVAHMIEAARAGSADRVLEVGTGSGYAAAVLSLLARQVFTIERHAVLAGRARRRFADLGMANVEVLVGDGSRGWPEKAPFDAIIVSAGARSAPAPLREQLAIGGRLVMPVGDDPHRQRLVRITREKEDSWREEDLGGVAFVPLIGEAGWPEPS